MALNFGRAMSRTAPWKLHMGAGALGARHFGASRAQGMAASMDASPTTSSGGKTDKARPNTLRQGANRNPELYVLAFVMSGAAILVGVFFSRKPTSATSEMSVAMVADSKPWQTEHGGKYEYHPGGDRTRAKKAAPSALHSSIIPAVSLPKNLHDQFNKYGKEEFDDY